MGHRASLGAAVSTDATRLRGSVGAEALSADQIAVLDARARSVGERIRWEMHFQVAPNPEFIGLTAGANHIFVRAAVTNFSGSARELRVLSVAGEFDVRSLLFGGGSAVA